MVQRRVLDSRPDLMRRVGRGNGPDLPHGGSADFRILLQKHDVATVRPGLDRRGETRPASTDHDDVELFSWQNYLLLSITKLRDRLTNS